MRLNNEQRAALWDPSGAPVRGHRLLSARPGTGKTTTLTSYCIDLADRWTQQHQPWQGIAMLSYTNVAKDELQHKIHKMGKAASLLQNPHFVGTVDAFVNQYLFLPHAANSMAFDGDRPTLVGEPYQQWKTPPGWSNDAPNGEYKTMWFDCYTIGLNGIPIRIDKEPRPGRLPVQPVTDANTSKIAAMKRRVWAQGLALQSDANYLAHQTLLSSPALTTAIVRRFPIIIVDEAQDLTEIQHAVLDHLVAAGHQHVVLVGDENQAIYEWNTARPELFTAKAAGKLWTATALTQSYRCSPAICETLTALAGDGSQLVAADDGKNKTYLAPVTVQESNADEVAAVRAAADQLADSLTGGSPHDDNDASIKSLLILTRGADHGRHLEAGYAGIDARPTERTVWRHPLTRDLLKVIYHLSLSNQYGAVEAYESLLRKLGGHASTADFRAAIRREWGMADDAVTPYRVALFGDLNALKSKLVAQPCQRISDCAAVCDVSLRAVAPSQLKKFRDDCAGFGAGARTKQNRLLSALFGAREARTWRQHPRHEDVRVAFATAHASKGETHDAVLLVTKKTAGRCDCPQPSTAWKTILQHSMAECEPKRIVYVAMSRAAQQLMILAPAGASDPWHALTPEDARPL
jgi:superfamily I DNA/RNA helicase